MTVHWSLRPGCRGRLPPVRHDRHDRGRRRGALLITTLEGSLLTPWLIGRAASMNHVAVFAGLLFWSWVWGHLGPAARGAADDGRQSHLRSRRVAAACRTSARRVAPARTRHRCCIVSVAVEPLANAARCLAILLLTMAATPIVLATARDTADESIRQFLEQDDTQPAYRAERRLEAETGGRRGWLQAVTSYAPGVGFRYDITAEGGSSFIRSRVLRAVLDGEREVIEHGETPALLARAGELHLHVEMASMQKVWPAC